VAIEHVKQAELETAIERARVRAAKTGELRPGVRDTSVTTIPDAVADFVEQILTDGTYAREVERIGKEDPDLANI